MCIGWLSFDFSDLESSLAPTDLCTSRECLKAGKCTRCGNVFIIWWVELWVLVVGVRSSGRYFSFSKYINTTNSNKFWITHKCIISLQRQQWWTPWTWQQIRVMTFTNLLVEILSKNIQYLILTLVKTGSQTATTMSSVESEVNCSINYTN